MNLVYPIPGFIVSIKAGMKVNQAELIGYAGLTTHMT
jgi:hypothetical protein